MSGEMKQKRKIETDRRGHDCTLTLNALVTHISDSDAIHADWPVARSLT